MAEQPAYKDRIAESIKRIDAATKKRQRSPSYPTVGLKEALERTEKFYKVDGKAGASAANAVNGIGFASAHGQALSVLSALKKFGLLTDKEGRVVPTQAAMELINLPGQDPRRIEALRKAALSPSIYRELLQEYKDGLPSDETLKAELITYKGFNPNAVDAFIKDFRSTLEFAGLSDFSMIESEYGASEEENTAAKETPIREKNPIIRVLNTEGRIPVSSSITPASVANSWTWTLSMPRNVRAELRIAGDVTKADIARLRQQIEFLEESFEEEAK